ncbi:Hypothetical protein NTJ_13490 [Nesidiocoris tenuis]|uniref:Uncharacterized protein n=1 Tax=Nesidiocoris tenuis TaxID=355587 RepID=A0ABN7B8U1_9HEMI|nr:Hypothetical protein NTJ_13490 [Nesidiocoris tenuis]
MASLWKNVAPYGARRLIQSSAGRTEHPSRWVRTVTWQTSILAVGDPVLNGGLLEVAKDSWDPQKIIGYYNYGTERKEGRRSLCSREKQVRSAETEEA